MKGPRGIARIREVLTDPVVWRFALTSLVVVAVIGVLLGMQMAGDLRQRRLEEAHARALVTGRMLQHELAMTGPAGAAHGDGLDAGLADAFERHLTPAEIPEASLWGPDGTLLFATTDIAAGAAADGGHDDPGANGDTMGEVLASGEPSSAIVELGEADAHHEASGASFVTYLPITLDADPEPDAVLELIQDYVPTATAIRAGLRTLALALAGGLLALYLLLLPVVATASSRLRRLVAERDEQVRRLQEAEQVKNTFLEAVSHELRTPLTAISGMLSLLDRFDGRLPVEQRNHLTSRARANASRLEKLLGDLLDVDRLTRGVITAHRVPVDLGRLVERTFADLRIERPVEIQTRPCPLRADPAQVERIVENLLANAVKYTEAETPIWVRVEPTEDGALLTVEDAGPGVPEGSHARIFEPFERAHDQRHAPGTGVGLALVARFAQMHDGEAWVEDRAGGGASFKVRLRDPAPDRTTPVAQRRRGATPTPQPASARAPQQLEPVGDRTRRSWVEAS